MSDVRTFTKLAHVGELVAIACTPDGRLVGVNDVEGRVWFHAAEAGEPLPLRFTPADATGVLLHPDGRVITYRCDAQRYVHVRIHDPRTGALLHDWQIGPVEHDGLDDEYDVEQNGEYERPSVAEGFHFDVAILQRPPPLDWLLPLEIANSRRESPVDWMSTLPDELRHGDMYPNRFTRMALHPNGRWLALLDRATWIVDLETGELVNSLGYGIDMASLFEYGEGTHTLGFDERGLLTIASVAISGNPFLQVDRIDVETGDPESSTENWRQVWGESDAPEIEVHIYDPTTFLPPERIPADSYKVLFRRRAIEVWSHAGLLRGVPVRSRTCVIPSFDPGSFCSSPRALLVTDTQIELLDLLTGERSLRRPPIDPLHTSKLSRIEFDPSRRRVLLWREQAALLTAPVPEDRWSVCELPEGRRMLDWAFASEPGRAFVVDDAGDLWRADVDPEPGPTPRPRTSLEPLQRALAARPHEAEPFLIYADALTDRGDPRGELIMLQHQDALPEAEALLREHDFELTGGLGELAPGSVELGWERGFVRTAKLQLEHPGQLDYLLAFLATESARLLESLELRMGRRSDADDVQAAYARIDAYLLAAGHLKWLRTRKFGN